MNLAKLQDTRLITRNLLLFLYTISKLSEKENKKTKNKILRSEFNEGGERPML